MENCKRLLQAFTHCFGPSGHEREVAALFKAEMTPLADDIQVDRVGNVICRFDGAAAEAPVVMVFAHLDQIGLIVRRIEPDGFLRLDRLGWVPDKVLPGLQIRLRARDGSYVTGVFGNKSAHANSAGEQNMVDELAGLYLDIGAASAGQVREMGLEVGSPATYMPSLVELPNDFVAGTALDNRGGLTALVLAAGLLKDRGPENRGPVYLVGTVWEEFNVRGAALAARAIQPDIAIALDVVLSGDTPDLAGRYNTACGQGPVVELYSFHGRGTLNGTLAHPGLVRLVEETSEKQRIPLQRFAGLGILTDSAYVQMEGRGPAALELGFVTRYTHTPTEMVCLRDIENLGRLAAETVLAVPADFDLNRYTI